MKPDMRLPLYCVAAVALVAVWSVYRPHDLFTWFLEAVPILVLLPLLAATYRRFRLTDLLYVLVAVHCFILLVGAHYTYAEVPLFNKLRDMYGLDRNYYDRVGHFFQGFVPVMAGRELLLRTSTLKRGGWMATLLVLSCLGISALYEIFEWTMSAMTGEAAESFLGTQGDVWDTQKDMLLAGIGAGAALLLLSRAHDRFLAKIKAA